MRLAVRLTAAALALLILLLVAGFAFLQTQTGGAAAARALSALASVPGETELRVGRVGPGLPFRLALAKLSLSDAEGEWLAADRIEVHWRPLALLRGRLSISEAIASGMRLSRVPEAAPNAEVSDRGFTLPSLPFDLRVDRFALDDVEIGPAVAGEALALRAGGEVAAERDGQIRTNIEIVRTNGVGAAAHLAVLWAPANERLSVDLHAEEPEGGLVGALLGLAGEPPVRLSFMGDGPITGWEGRLEGSVGEDVGINARIISGDAPEGTRIDISGTARLAALLPDAARALAAGGITFAASLRRPEAGVLAIDSADVAAGGLRLAAAGGLDLDEERFDDVRLTLVVADTAALVPVLAPASLEAGEARLSLSGPWAAPAAELSADIVNMRASGASVAHTVLQAEVKAAPGGPVEVEADGTFRGVRAGAVDVDAVLGGPPRLLLGARLDATQGNQVFVDRIKVQTPALAANGRGTYALASGDSEASLRVVLPNLAAFRRLAGIELAGSSSLDIQARSAAGSIDGTLDLASTGFRSAIPAADVLLGAGPSLRAALHADPASGQVRLADVVLAGEGIRATAAATLKDSVIDAAYQAHVLDVAAAAAASGVTAAGALTLDGTLSGSAGDPNTRAVLTLADGHVADVVSSPVRIELTAETLITRPRGLLTATAAAAGEPLRLAVPFARDSVGAVHLGPLDGSGAGARLSGSLTLPPAGGVILGTLTLSTGGEGRTVRLAGNRLDGTTELRVALGERKGEQTIEVDGTGHSLALATPAGPIGAADSLRLSANLTGAGDPHGDIVLSIVRPTAGGMSVLAIDATVTGSPQDARYALTAKLADDPARAIHAGGTIARENGRARITVTRLDGDAGGQRLDLRRPLTVMLSDGETSVSDLDLAIGSGAITAPGRTGQAGTEGRLVLSRLPLSLARAVQPGLDVDGMLDGEASLSSEGADLVGRLDLNLSGVRAATMAQAPPLEATASARLAGGVAAVAIRIPRLGDGPLELDASVPARVDARTLAVEVPEQAPLRGRLTWAGPVTRLWELAPLSEQRLTGDAEIDLALSGTLAAPELSGRAELAGGRYEHFLTGTVIDGLSLQAQPTGAGGIALTLRGNDGATGTIAGDGRIALAKGMAPQAELVVTFAKATLVRRDDVTATMTGAMTFRQDETGASLSGEFASDRMEVRLIDRLPPSVVVLDVTEINLPPGYVPRRAEEAPATTGPVIALDIAVKLPRRVYVRGRGLESEWEGDLHVSGTSAEPRLIGTVAIRTGTFDFASKRFTLETGEIGFTGGKTINPTLNVRAVRTTPELTAVIRVTGTALEPEIELTSTPVLPESEILSRVLFGKGVAKLGPVEAAQLAMALDTLASGESMSEDALSYVRNLLGLDVLTIQPGEEEGEGPALGVGRYVAEGVYVGARQGAQQDSTAGTVEIEVLPGLAIESELGDSAQGATGALGLRWKWDY